MRSIISYVTWRRQKNEVYAVGCDSAGFSGQRPNTSLPQRLLDLRFHLAAGLSDGDTTRVNFSASSTSAGYGFQGTPAQIEVGPACNLDVDGNGQVDALTDGVLTVRYEFGFTGATLIDSAVGPGCINCTAPEIEAYLQQCEAGDVLNVDGNPNPADALTDGVLTVRYDRCDLDPRCRRTRLHPLYGGRNPGLLAGPGAISRQ